MSSSHEHINSVWFSGKVKPFSSNNRTRATSGSNFYWAQDFERVTCCLVFHVEDRKQYTASCLWESAGGLSLMRRVGRKRVNLETRVASVTCRNWHILSAWHRQWSIHLCNSKNVCGNHWTAASVSRALLLLLTGTSQGLLYWSFSWGWCSFSSLPSDYILECVSDISGDTVADTALCTPVAWPKSNSLLYCLTLLFTTMSYAARPYQPSRHYHCYHLLVIPLAICGVTVHCTDATPRNKRPKVKTALLRGFANCHLPLPILHCRGLKLLVKGQHCFFHHDCFSSCSTWWEISSWMYM